MKFIYNKETLETKPKDLFRLNIETMEKLYL